MLQSVVEGIASLAHLAQALAPLIGSHAADPLTGTSLRAQNNMQNTHAWSRTFDASTCILTLSALMQQEILQTDLGRKVEALDGGEEVNPIRQVCARHLHDL